MSVPASRIRQIRAMFAKAKKQLQITHPFMNYEPLSRPGRGELSAWVAAKPNIIRRLKDLKAGKRVIVPEPPYPQRFRASGTHRNPASVPVRDYAEQYNNTLEAYNMGRGAIRRWIKSDYSGVEKAKRIGARRNLLNLRKQLKRSESE